MEKSRLSKPYPNPTEKEVLQRSDTVSIVLRPATAKDFSKEMSVVEEGRVIIKTLPKTGQPFWVKSEITGNFDEIHYQISDHTNWTEFKDYLRRGMVYVPKTFRDR